MDNNTLGVNTTEEQLLDFQPVDDQSTYIKVIGVGGAGTNAVNHMFKEGITGVDFLVCNTDKQSLDASPIKNTLKIGKGLLGAGNNPAVAKEAAIEAEDEIRDALSNGTRMLFITAGMGGGTGTGASPEIARIAKTVKIPGEENEEILVVAVVNTPFSHEGRKRKEQAKNGIEELRKVVDAIIVVNTDKLKNRGVMSMSKAFAAADDVLLTAVKGISEIMTSDAYMHVDFRDVQSVMKNSGVALMGIGVGEGQDRARQAIEQALTNDLLNDDDLSQTKNVLYYVSCSSKDGCELSTEELAEITNYIEEHVNADVDVIWGYGYDDSLEDKVSITLVATGFESKDIYSPTTRINTNKEEKKVEVKLDTKPEVTPRVEPVVEEKKEPDTEFVVKQKEVVAEPVKEEAKIEEPVQEQPQKVVYVLDVEDSATPTPEPMPTISEPVQITIDQTPVTPAPEIKPVEVEAKVEVAPVEAEVERVEVEEKQIELENNSIEAELVQEPVESAVKQETVSTIEVGAKSINIVEVPTAVAVEEPKPVVENTVHTMPHQTLGEVINGQNARTSSSVSASAAEKAKMRASRMEMIRKMLATPDGVKHLEESRPYTTNEFSTVYSAQDEKTERFAMSSAGNIVYTENPTLNSSVD